jgi:hypothetical protein
MKYRTGGKPMSRHSRISRRDLIVGAAGTLALATSGRAIAQAAKPNIVFILADDAPTTCSNNSAVAAVREYASVIASVQFQNCGHPCWKTKWEETS